MNGARLEIDLAAFRENVRILSQLVRPATTMLAVKANAYGHGMLPMARAALEAGADSLAVLEVPAALALREAGISAPILAWLHGVDTDFAAAVRTKVDLGISTLQELEAVIAASSDGVPGRVHLKIDTGLHRNGARPEDWPALVAAAVSAERVGTISIVGLWSHLADASPEDDAEALEKFLAAVEVARSLGCTAGLLHLAASSAGIREPEARLGMVRFGIAAYGISPFDDESGAQLGLTPVMSMRAPILGLAGGIATIGLGSADGIQIPAIGAAEVAIRGTRFTIASLDIDSLTVDVSDSAIEVGEEVTVFGSGAAGEATAEQWAVWGATVGDEIVARAGDRLPRIYLG